MKFGKFVVFLFLIYEAFFYLAIGQTINNDKTDCTKLYNYINGNFENYSNNCCGKEYVEKCDDEGYIKKL